jgi:hypothetical protein
MHEDASVCKCMDARNGGSMCMVGVYILVGVLCIDLNNGGSDLSFAFLCE